MRWLDRLTEWFKLAVDPRRALEVEFVEDAPDVVEETKLYLVGQRAAPWSAMFVCPCGCKATVALSLIPDDQPRWRARYHADGTLSLSPSIWRTRGCHSHFFIRHGKVVWALAERPRRRRRR